MNRAKKDEGGACLDSGSVVSLADTLAGLAIKGSAISSRDDDFIQKISNDKI